MSDDDFHATLGRLRAERDAIERDFNAALERLDERVEAARGALETAGEVAARGAAAPSTEGPDAPSRAPAGLEQEPWPRSSGLRGLVDRFARWLMREHLAVLDRRHRAIDEALERVATTPTGPPSVPGGVDRAHVEAIRELAGRAAEAVESAATAVRRSRDLLNAKEAETVHVATHGARAQTELTLQELARQQEALLAELVGRRRELDRLLSEVRSGEPDC